MNETEDEPDPNYLASLHRHINELRDQYCDFTIIIGDTKFRVHKYILIIWSDYFRALFRHENLESTNDEIKLDYLNGRAIELILDYCYRSTLQLDDQIIQDVLIASNMLQIKPVLDKCENYILTRLDKTNCLGVLRMADQFNLKGLYESTLEYCLINFLELTDEGEYLQLQGSCLKRLVENDILNVDNELLVVKAILKWSSANQDFKDDIVDSILSKVRFTLMKPKDLVDLSADETISKLPISLRLINQAKDYHLLLDDQGRDEVTLDCISKPRLTVSRRQRIYAIGGWSENQPIADVEKYDPLTDEWSECQPLSTRRIGFGCAVLGRYIYVIGGHDGTRNLKTVERYDLLTEKWLSDVADMSIERSSVSVVATGGYLYAIGGESCKKPLDIVERYNPTANRWTLCAPLTVNRLGSGVAALDDYIYVIGGVKKDTNLVDVTLDSVERYDIENNRWTFVEPMHSPRKHFGCMSYNGLIYVMGGLAGNLYVNTVEVLNPMENGPEFHYSPLTCLNKESRPPKDMFPINKWTVLQDIQVSWSGFGLVHMDDLFYAIGGLDPTDVNNIHSKSVRVFDSETKQWCHKRDLIKARLGGGLVAACFGTHGFHR